VRYRPELRGGANQATFRSPDNGTYAILLLLVPAD
jgi:hypothetical protein